MGETRTLVERLRGISLILWDDRPSPRQRIIHEAADTIERQEREIERLRQARQALGWALAELDEEGGCGCGDDDCSWCGPYERACRALAQTGGET